jgi:hypothetical protein
VGCHCNGSGGVLRRYQLVKTDGTALTYASKTEALAALSAAPRGSRVVTTTP